MPPVTAARRYAPLLALAALQVLIVAVVPSKGQPSALDSLTGLPGAGQGVDGGPVAEGLPGAEGVPGADPLAPGGTAGQVESPGGAGGGGAATAPGATADGATSAPSGAGGSTGDRSKCAKDGQRQQDVTLTGPPCMPRFTGDNGGATYQGVTAKEITVLRYRPQSNAQVDAILRTQGLASSPEEEDHAMRAFAAFFEKRYEHHGRKIKWVTVQGECQISPPDLPCFRDEAKRLNAEHKPFGIFWMNSTTQAEFFDQWSRLGVVNVGGWHFPASFNQALRPFHYDVFMDGTRTVNVIADYWCKKMRGKNAALAGDPTLQAKPRKLGILTQVYPETRKNALELYRLVSGGRCGSRAEVAEPVYTPSDIARGQETANVAVQKLKAEGVTTLVIISDPINPTFTTTAATRQRWFPEHLLSGSGLIDYDALGRLYDQNQWRNAFGPSQLAEPTPLGSTDAFKAARDVGVTNIYSGANLLWSYMNLMATALQVAGPTVTPQTLERGLLALPPSGGWERTKNPSSVLVKYGPNDYTAVEDARQAVWNPTARSPIDGKPGTYTGVESGRRYEIGTFTTSDPKR